MGMAKIPARFDRVVSIEAAHGNQAVTLRSTSGKQAQAKVDLDFLQVRTT